jgi:fructose-1,6-bisphosphatase/inositol monophosphatase family enzyme
MNGGSGSTVSGRAFVEAMTLPVRQAMAVVRWLEGRVPNRPKLEEVTPEKAALTDGDCVAQEILLVALHAHFPQLSLSVEEDTPSAALFGEELPTQRVTIDPIDGTIRYLQRDGPYAILVGLELEGRVEASLVGLPLLGKLIRAVRGEGTEIADWAAPFRALSVSPEGRVLLVSYGLGDEVRARLEASGYKLVTAAGAAIGVAPLLEGTFGALRLTANAEGLSHRMWISALPTLEAGGVVESLDGAFPERYREEVSGVIVGPSPGGVAQIRDALRA